jgi:xanthine dehydrogenase YagR molybdenum-binding subunit
MPLQLFLSEHEGTEIDPRNARYVNGNLGDRIPLNDRLRSVKVSLVAEENQLERGLGEPANFGTARALLAASDIQ